VSSTLAIALALTVASSHATSMQPSAPPEAGAPAPAETAPGEAAPGEAAPAPAEPAPAPAPAPAEAQPAPAEPPPASPPPPGAATPPPADSPRDSGAGKPLLITGIAITIAGGVALIFIAAPSAIVRTVALDRASRDPIVGASSREERYERARVADDVMEGAFWTGIACLGIGVPLTIAGAVIRNRASDDVARRVQLDAAGATLRF
jgi:hypothetical protein